MPAPPFGLATEMTRRHGRIGLDDDGPASISRSVCSRGRGVVRLRCILNGRSSRSLHLMKIQVSYALAMSDSASAEIPFRNQSRMRTGSIQEVIGRSGFNKPPKSVKEDSRQRHAIGTQIIRGNTIRK